MDDPQETPQEPRTEPEARAAATGLVTGGRALLAYATRHGSTKEIADAVAEELRSVFADVDVSEARSAPSPAGYDAVVLGGPMIMGWHKDAKKYLKRNKDRLAAVPFALFVTAASLTEDGVDAVQGMPIAKDPWLVKKPRNADKLSRKERYALPRHYVGDILKLCTPARPRSVALFAGSLDLTTMNLLEKAFVLVVIGATPGDGRHVDFVREWARKAATELTPG
jgi:menaquinone-dependent protoporphyrinogen oxidase